MKLLAQLFLVLTLLLNTNSDSSLFESSQAKNHALMLSKNQLDLNTTYFFSDNLFNGKKFTVKGFKVKFSGRPVVVSNEIAFGNNLKFILKRQEIGSKILIYDIETFMLENEKVTHRPSGGKVSLEITLTK